MPLAKQAGNPAIILPIMERRDTKAKHVEFKEVLKSQRTGRTVKKFFKRGHQK